MNQFFKIIIVVGIICILVGNWISYHHKEIIYVEKCTCVCHTVHALKEERDLAMRAKEREEKREFLGLMSAEESKEMMKRQTEECNRPFVEFMEWLKQKTRA